MYYVLADVNIMGTCRVGVCVWELFPIPLFCKSENALKKYSLLI